MRRWRAALAGIAGILMVLGSGAALRAEPLEIRVGWVVVPANLPPILFAKQGVARYLGRSYAMEPAHFGSTPPMIAALASGELDVAFLTYSSFALAVENAGMSDLGLLKATVDARKYADLDIVEAAAGRLK